MEPLEPKEDQNFSAEAQNNKNNDDEISKLLQSLEQQMNWDGRRLVNYEDCWCSAMFLREILSAQKHFKAEDNDIIQASLPKCGTTWLKALTFSIAKRGLYPIDQSPLLTSNPHKLVPFLEFEFPDGKENPNLGHMPSPRIFATHLSYNTLPKSIVDSNCRIIYITRNPLDQFISNRIFLLENMIDKNAVPLGLDESFDLFCRGVHSQGPFWEHMLGYWNAHLKNPRKVLFLKYEDLKEDITSNVKKIAEFIGCPFSEKEEDDGAIQEISNLCSFDKLRNLEVNKTSAVTIRVRGGKIKNDSFFRKGEVGDWNNYLSPDMAERIVEVKDSKFKDSGLTLKIGNSRELLKIGT